MPKARGRGFATEATAELLEFADTCDDGEVLCIIAADNFASRRVADKVGFRGSRHFVWPDGILADLLIRPVGSDGPPLSPPG